MQNVMLPDKSEVEAQNPESDPLWPTDATALADWAAANRTLAILRAEVVMLKTWLRALYAKHGEECPLFKEEE